MKALQFCLIMALVACGSPEGEKHEEGALTVENTGPSEGMVRTDLAGEDLPMTIDTPQLPDGLSPEITWKEEFGHVEVKAGDHFGLTISEVPGDLERKKGDLERDLLQTHEILQEESNMLVYKSTFPDSENLIFVHMYKVIETDGRTFVVEDLASGQYSESDINRMMGSLHLKKAI